ncbi:MAG TPA: integrase core domain-containing protein [Thermoanaerobaculia bacterium]|nr:integrase core domain-containing protein [Thermoanaerobaculia bacterium]
MARQFPTACAGLNVRHKRTRPYTARTNGKAERFIQTLLREWAYRFAYDSSEERKRWLPPYLHFYHTTVLTPPSLTILQSLAWMRTTY